METIKSGFLSIGSLTEIISRSGLMRPGIKPTWMPSFSRVTASGNLSPVLMHPAAFFTTSEVMKLSVPS